jgi:hypothetical protein
MVSDFILEHPVSLKKAYAHAFHVLLPTATINGLLTLLLGILIIFGLFGGAFVMILLEIDPFHPIMIIAVILIFCFTFLPVFFLWTRFSLLYPVIINEQLFLHAFKRSWNLLKGQTIRVFFSLFLLFLFFPGTLISMASFEAIMNTSSDLTFILYAFLAQALIVPLLDTGRTLIYFQLRTHKEGFHLKQKIEHMK